MSSDERRSPEPRTDEHHQVLDKPEERPPTEKPDVTDEHKETAKKMAESYEEDRPTIKMPGTGGSVAGTAVNEWVDDEGKPRFSDKNDEV